MRITARKSKQRKTLRIRIPPYRRPRNEWRGAIYAELKKAALERRVKYHRTDRLELIVTLYIGTDEIGWHDVDNRLKGILDALQGRAGGPKAERPLKPIVPNDSQIYKVTIEKRTHSPQSRGFGHLIVKRYKE